MPNAENVTSLRDGYRQELDHNRLEIAEIDRLLRQATVEAEKLGQRETNTNSQIRNIQANIDRFSKEDIRNVFVTVQEVQVRLLSARMQVEQLQDKQKRLHDRQVELGTLIDVLDEMGQDSRPVTISAQMTQAQDALISQVIQAQEKERLRLSLQMHDGPAQMLSNLILRAEICERMLDHDVNLTRSELAALKKAIHAVLQETRRFIFDLRPMILDDLGLVPTLRRYTQDFTEKWRIDASVAVQNLDGRLPAYYEVALFRFIQEALNNVQKHATASHARVTVDGLGGQLQVTIEDDGSGFNVGEALSGGRSNRNMGFAVMKQQVETLLKGQLGVESAPGQGTRVIASVPMAMAQDVDGGASSTSPVGTKR